MTYEFQPDTQEYKALVSLLNNYDYHRSFLTLLPLEDYTPDSNTTTFQLQSTDSQYLLTDKGGFSAEPVSGGKSLVYAIGRWKRMMMRKWEQHNANGREPIKVPCRF